jgi:HK97 family phage prohead protease
VTGKHERRTFRNVEVRATDKKGPNGRPIVTLRAITPYVVDDYGSVWLPHTFDAAMEARMAADPHDTPALCWAHDWTDPIGHGVDYRKSADGPEIDFELDEFDAVPRARQADAQVRSKTIRDCSVGFFDAKRREPTDEERVRWPGVIEVMESADLDETSLVLRGAVPGAKVAGIRGAKVDLDALVEIAKRKAAGEMTDEEARAAVELLTEAEEITPAKVEPKIDDAPGIDHDQLDADADAVLDMVLGRSGRRPEVRFPDIMSDDVRAMLRTALDAKFGSGPNMWIWVRDFSDTEVIYEAEGYAPSGAFRLDYTLSGNVVTLAEQATPVRLKTTYVPVS